jgi:hypothetical protein
VEVSTGCRDETAARTVLAELEKRADKVRSGLRTDAEDRAVDHQRSPLADHIDAFLDHQNAEGQVFTSQGNAFAVADRGGRVWVPYARVDRRGTISTLAAAIKPQRT